MSMKAVARISALVTFAFAALVAMNPLHVSAATQIYYSVGQNVLDHKTGSPTVTIDGSGNATFSVAQTGTTTGIGDMVTYGTVGKAFITGKVSTTVWTVETATGGLPSATSSATVNSIAHAFASLNAAVGVGVSGNATSSSFLNTSDLTSGSYVLNIPLYYDSGSDTTKLTIDGFTTSAANYINIYTPTSTASQVNQSQRHGGKWDTTKYNLDVAAAFAPVITIGSTYVRFDGLQIRNNSSNSQYVVNYALSSSTAADDVYVSNSIFNIPTSRTSLLVFPSGKTSTNTRNVYIWNNIFSNANSGGAISISNGWTANFYIYNNTFFSNNTGVSMPTFTVSNQSVIAKNNLFASTTYPFTPTAVVGTATDYNSTDATTTGYRTTGGQGAHDLFSQAISFIDAPNLDFHLASSTAGALDVGLSLSSDSNLPFSVDYDLEARPNGTAWDIGADEFNASYGDLSPPILSLGSPSGAIATSSSSTTLSVATTENATCKYDTNAGTVYSSMAGTFTTTGGMSHSATISGLSSGHIYTYYVRCQDVAGNTNLSDYTISFNVGTNGVAYANSCSMSDVQAALNIAVPGDTVSIPAGTCTWGASGTHVNITKAVTLSGAGQDITVLTLASTTPSYGSGALQLTAAATVKDMTVNTWSGGVGNSSFVSLGSGIIGFRITNIKYVDQQISSGYFVYFGTGSYGLIDNNNITGGNGQNELIFGYGPTDSWQSSNSMGSSTALFIEHNTFGGSGYLNDCNANSRCVVRYNTITTGMKTDSHGKASNTPARSVRQTEVYNNVWTASSFGSAAIEMRGGTGMVFNNSVPNVSNAANAAWFYLHDYGYDGGPWPNYGVTISSISVGNPTTITTASPHGFVDQQLVTLSSSNSTPTVNSTYTATVTGPNTFTIPVNVTVAGTTGNASDYQTPYDYPLADEIGTGMDPKVAGSEPFYVWNNLKGGGTWPLTLSSIPANAIAVYRLQIASTTATYTENDLIQSNREYFADSGTDTSTTTAGVTQGLLSARPSTCRTGTGYWATDQGGSWDTSNGTSSDGALYKCVSTNTWALYYRPYAYPHYLTAASTTVTDQVDVGAGARVFGNGKFYGFSTSTASGALATIGATTTSSDPDAWIDLTIQTWSNTGTRHKAWTETSTSMGATTTHHVIGDLSPNTAYAFMIDGSPAVSNISSAQCSSGTCTSNSSGKIYFDYTGGYSTHTFDINQSSGVSSPTLLTPTFSSTSFTSTVASSTISSDGGASATSTGFVYGVTTAYGATTTPATGTFAAPYAFSGTISGLTCGITYHVKSFATNSAGISYSTDATVSTTACSAPSISIPSASSITATTADLSSNIVSNGGDFLTDEGFVYGLTSAYTATSSTFSNIGFGGTISSLTCNTTYHAAAYGTNSAGTGYSSDTAFTTSACSTASVPASGVTATVSSGHRSPSRAPQALAVQTASISAPSLSEFIKILISAGVIPQDKATQALSIITTPSFTTSQPPSRNLQYHDKNSSVQSLQAVLHDKGYLSAAPNGVFGPQTLAALKFFQKANGIPATGFYGPLTRAAMGR